MKLKEGLIQNGRRVLVIYIMKPNGEHVLVAYFKPKVEVSSRGLPEA